MLKKAGIIILVGLLALSLSGVIGTAEEAVNLESLFNNMSIEELEQSETVLQRVLNEKKIAGAVLMATPSSGQVALGKTVNISVSSDGREITKTTKIDYETSDAEIAIVKGGVVTGKGPGMATIKVTALFDDGAILEASCNIQVIVPVTKLNVTGKASVFAGETLDIASLVSVIPENASEQGLTYIVSDSDIASITDDGVLTGIKAGNVTVVVTSKEDTAKPQTGKLMISVVQPVTGVRFPETRLEVGKGKSIQLQPVVEPEDATNTKLIWKSSAPEVAKVSATGVVTGVKTGKAGIMCTAADGSEIKASVVVNVITPVASIKFPTKSEILIMGQDSIVHCDVLPKDATNRNVKYISSDTNVVTVDTFGKIVATGRGTCTITAIAMDGSNVSASLPVKVESKFPIEVTRIHWQTVWGMIDGRMGVEATNYCSYSTIKSFDYTVKCYIGSMSSDPAVSYMTYDGKAIAPGKTGKSKLSSSSVSGFRTASFVEVIPTCVYFADGTYYYIPQEDWQVSKFDMR